MNENMLKGYIVKTFGTQTNCASEYPMSMATLSRKINGIDDFTKREMEWLRDKCKMSDKDFLIIFFS